MGPALSPPYGFLHASTDEAVCEPEGRPAPQPAKGPTTCARRSEGRGVLKAAPRNPGFTIDGSPLGADSSSLGGNLTERGGGGRWRVGGSAAQLYAVVDRTGEPSKRRLSTQRRGRVRGDKYKL
ncbi:MAG: hypothetical protein QW086_05925 [Pyrobaculum sp.]